MQAQYVTNFAGPMAVAVEQRSPSLAMPMILTEQRQVADRILHVDRPV
jgi:hypothetical protein